MDKTKKLTMKEQLISFGTAKLAKEKGFNISTENLYDRRDYNKSWDSVELFNRRNAGLSAIPAPTQSLLQKWLREEHEIHININTFYFEDLEKYGYEVEDIIHKNGWVVMSNTAGTYEEALEKGLQKALELIP